MTHVITSACVGVCDTACVASCPVDCIHPSDGYEDKEGKQLYIDPEECVDCSACVPECPVNAIYSDADLPEDQQEYLQINADYFKNQE